MDKQIVSASVLMGSLIESNILITIRSITNLTKSRYLSAQVLTSEHLKYDRVGIRMFTIKGIKINVLITHLCIVELILNGCVLITIDAVRLNETMEGLIQFRISVSSMLTRKVNATIARKKLARLITLITSFLCQEAAPMGLKTWWLLVLLATCVRMQIYGGCYKPIFARAEERRRIEQGETGIPQLRRDA